MPTEFYYKGLSIADRTFPHSPSKAASLAKGTLYETWFDVLQASPWYLQMAETGVCLSSKSQEAWEKFGDLRNTTFTDWWLRTGYQIFAEVVPYREIQTVDIAYEVRHSKNEVNPPMLRLDVPINLSPAELQEQFNKILRAHQNYYYETRDYERWSHSTAPVHQFRESRLSYDSIKRLLDFYKDYEKEKTERNIKLHEYAIIKKIIPASLRRRRDLKLSAILTSVERGMLANAVSDKLKQIRYIMANATELRFPDDTPHDWAKSGSRGQSDD